MSITQRGDRSIHWTSEGDGPTVVLVPGLGSGARLFGTLPRRFARQGFRCVTFDPVGLAPSSSLPGPYQFDAAALDVLAVAADATQGAPYALVGTSLGGKVSLTAAALAVAQGGSTLQRMVLLASAATTSARAKRVYDYFLTVAQNLPGEQLGPATAPFLFGRTFHEERPGVVDNIVRATKPDAASLAFMASQAHALQSFDGRSAAESIHIPTLCMAGAEDTLTDAVDVERTADLLAQGTFQLVPNAGHSLLLEDGSVFDTVAAFCRPS